MAVTNTISIKKGTFAPGLFVALIVPILFSSVLRFIHAAARLPFDANLAWVVAFEWAAALAVLALVRVHEHLPFTSLGLHRLRWGDIGWGILFWIIGLLAFVVTLPLAQAVGVRSATLTELARIPLALRIALPLTAGVCEEILFRGYAIERLTALFGSKWIAAALSLICFSAYHIAGFGLGGALQIAAWSVVVTSLYLWKRSLPACILMHILNDGYAYIVLPFIFRA
jgi:membrane protease YdiL (CAAX protease family)